MKIPVFFLSVFLAVFSPLQAHAQNHAQGAVLPEDIRGNVWILPDCDHTMLGFFFGQRFVLQLAPGGHLVARITDIHPAQSGPGAWEIKRADEDHVAALRALANGTLLYSVPFSVGFSEKQPARAEEDNDFLMRLKQCPAPPAAMIVDDDMKVAFASFERADAICIDTSLKESPDCRRAVFDIGDTDVNGALDEKELARLWGYIAWLAEGRTCSANTPFPPEHGEADGAAFAKQALTMTDADKSGALNLEEIETFLPAFAVTGYGVKLHALLASAALVLVWAVNPPPYQ